MTDEAERREAYRLARRAYLEAKQTCEELSSALFRAKTALDNFHTAKWPPAVTQREIAPPPAPGQQIGRSPFPTVESISTAIEKRHAAISAIKAAWEAMSRVEQDDSPEVPKELNLTKKYQ